jgi:hypothetical protein
VGEGVPLPLPAGRATTGQTKQQLKIKSFITYCWMHVLREVGDSKICICAVLRVRIRIRYPIPFWPLDPGWVKNQDPHQGRNILDHTSESLETRFWARIRNLFDPGTGMEKFGSRIRDKHPGSATLHLCKLYTSSTPETSGGFLLQVISNRLTPQLCQMKIYF